MNRLLLAAALLLFPLGGFPASAQTPLAAPAPLAATEEGRFLVRVRAIDVLPRNSASSVSVIGGSVHATDDAAPEVDLSYFLTNHLALEAIFALTRPVEVSARGTAIGTIDVGKVKTLSPSLTLQYHFLPHAAFRPYLGAGLNATFFYGSEPAKPAITHVSYRNGVGAVLEAGFDYQLYGPWFANFDFKQIFLHTQAHIDSVEGRITARTWVNPMVIGAGIGYRF